VDTHTPSEVEALDDGEAYKGRLLLSIETETLDSCATSFQMEPPERRVIRRPAIPLIEVSKRFINEFDISLPKDSRIYNIILICGYQRGTDLCLIFTNWLSLTQLQWYFVTDCILNMSKPELKFNFKLSFI
jgi:hypothetical protein